MGESSQGYYNLFFIVFTITSITRAISISYFDQFLTVNKPPILSLTLLISIGHAIISFFFYYHQRQSGNRSDNYNKIPHQNTISYTQLFLVSLLYQIHNILFIFGLSLCGGFNTMLLESSTNSIISILGCLLRQTSYNFSRFISGVIMLLGYVVLGWSKSFTENFRSNSIINYPNVNILHNPHPIQGISILLFDAFVYFLYQHLHRKISTNNKNQLQLNLSINIISSFILTPLSLFELITYGLKISYLHLIYNSIKFGICLFGISNFQHIFSYKLGEKLLFLTTFIPSISAGMFIYIYHHNMNLDLSVVVCILLILIGHYWLYLPNNIRTMKCKEIICHFLSSKQTAKLLLYFSINLTFMFVEFLIGFLTNSLGMMSDAGHMLFDSTALFLGLIASYMSSLNRNEVYTYGYSRIEVLAGLVNGIFLVLIGFSIGLEAIHRLLHPPEVSTDYLLTVAVLGFLVNAIGIIFFHGDHGNDNMNGIFLHVLADTLGSVGVIISTILIQFFGLHFVDPICALVITFLIIISVIPLITSTLSTLNQKIPLNKRRQFNYVLNQITNIEGVESISKKHLWKIGDDNYVCTLHIHLGFNVNQQELLVKCNKYLDEIHVSDKTIQFETSRFRQNLSYT